MLILVGVHAFNIGLPFHNRIVLIFQFDYHEKNEMQETLKNELETSCIHSFSNENVYMCVWQTMAIEWSETKPKKHN